MKAIEVAIPGDFVLCLRVGSALDDVEDRAGSQVDEASGCINLLIGEVVLFLE